MQLQITIPYEYQCKNCEENAKKLNPTTHQVVHPPYHVRFILGVKWIWHMKLSKHDQSEELIIFKYREIVS